MTNAQLPSDVTECLNRHELNHRPILLSTDSDISLAGDYRRNWLVVTADHLSVVAAPEVPESRLSPQRPVNTSRDDGDATLVRAVPVKEIKAVRTWAGLGSGVLQVRTENAWVDLLRYSNAQAERFHKVSRKLDVFCTGGELTVMRTSNWTLIGVADAACVCRRRLKHVLAVSIAVRFSAESGIF